MEEILYKLPVKSLLRFKCVSKSWRSSISSKAFIREHLNKSKSGTDFAHHNLTFTYHKIAPLERAIGTLSRGTRALRRTVHKKSRSREKCIGSLSLGSLLNDDEVNRSNLSIPIPIPIPIPAVLTETDAMDFLCSCNGLILFTVNHWELYLWNPSTRKAKYILNPRETAWWGGCHRSGYGLGYDESTDDYKIVCIFSGQSQLGRKKQTYMYSSRTGSWKMIQNPDKGSLSRPANFVNARLHWLTDADQDRARYIVSLDLVEEKYQIVPLPHFLSDDYYDPNSCFLKDLGGYLSFVGNTYITRSRDFWIMKKEYWSKIWTSTSQMVPHPMPLLLKKNEDILVAFGMDLTIYHGENKLRQSRVHMLEPRIDPIVYVESLISPFSDDEQQLHRH